MNDITPEEAIEILSHYTDLGYGIVIEHEDVSKIIQALSLARKTLANGTPYNPPGECEKCPFKHTEKCDVCINRLRNMQNASDKSQGDCISRSWVEHNVLSLMDAETRIYAQGRLDNAPTVEAYTSEDIVKYVSATEDLVREKLERPKGEWIIIHHKDILGSWGNWYEYKCSVCKKSISHINKSTDYATKFCPNCGAQMLKGDNNG